MTNEMKPEGQPPIVPEPHATAPADAASSDGQVAGQTGPNEAIQPQSFQPQSSSAQSSSAQSSGEMTLAVAEAAIGALQTEVAELKDRLLRTHADIENMRKRAEKEKADTHKYAVTKFARDMIEVGDNFQRAIATVPAGAA